MVDVNEKDYIVVVQCHLVKQRCSGYQCEQALNERTGGFTAYPKDRVYRSLNMTCGGCCGLATQRKLSNVVRQIKRKEDIEKDRIVVHLSSCITKDNHHGPKCPHIDYIKALIAKLGLDVCDDTVIVETAEKLRAKGVYDS